MPCHHEKCPFKVKETELFRFNGQPSCIYHAPIDKKYGWGKIKKENFNEKIYEYVDRSINENKAVNLSYVVFPGVIDFSGKTFPGLNLEDAKFYDSVSFFSAKFLRKANFKNVHFQDMANFSGACFSKEVDFEGATFHFGGEFEKTKFFGFSNFTRVTFKGVAFFREAEFHEDALFYNAGFEATVNFGFTKFIKTSDFLEAGFEELAEFDEVQFNGSADFSAIVKENSNDSFQEVIFDVSNFGAEVTFNNRKFKAKTSFEECTFISAPEFHNSPLHQDTDFPPERFFKDTKSKGAASAYRTLKLAMENARARKEEAMFYALEQKSLRNDPEVSKAHKIFSWLYEEIAEYGQSLSKPLIYLGAVILGFFGFYFAIACNFANQKSDIWNLAIKTFGFSFKQAFQPFYILRQPSLEWVSEITGVRLVKIAATLESLFIIALFAIFLLGLRWHFKRG